MHKPFITITHGMSGYFAVLMSWYDDESGGMWGITQTGIGRYKEKEKAETDGREWATAKRLEFK